MNTRVGQGFDVHAFCDGDHVVIGGVRIPFPKGLRAHSDGDVALHALCDALLGAAALGDIGAHFPPDDPQWRDADSSGLLGRVRDLLVENGWRVGNCDITVICEHPRVSEHSEAMRANVASVLGIPDTAVSIKGKTSEKLGFIGREEGIAAMAVAQIEEKS